MCIIIQNINTCLKIHCPCKKIAHIRSFQTKISIIIKNNNSVCYSVCLFEIEGGINLVSKRLNGLKYQLWPTNFFQKYKILHNTKCREHARVNFIISEFKLNLISVIETSMYSMLTFTYEHKWVHFIIYTYTCDCMHNFSVQGRKSKCTTISSDREKC